ncbi:MAG: ATP-binding protein [Pseudomonadota bacterium]
MTVNKAGTPAENLHILHPADIKTTEDSLLNAVYELNLPAEAVPRVHALLKAQHNREKESAERLQTILDSVVEGILIIDGAGKILDCNQSARVLLRGNSQRLDGTSVEIMFVDRKSTVRHKLLNRCINISSGMLRYDYTETMGQRLDGDTFPMEVIVSPAYFRGETSYLYIFRDITRRKQAEISQVKLENELREALKLEAIGHLAGGIAHEINTPSQYIRDNLKFLNDGYGSLSRILGLALHTLWQNRAYLPDGTFNEFAKKLRAADLEFLLDEIPHATQQSLDGINQVARIVLSMKEFSHPGGAEKTATDINRVLANVIVISRNEWKHHSHLTEDFEPEIPHIPCFINEINQVFLNLIVNAAQAIASSGRPMEESKIHISTRFLDDSILISISDTGTGIAEENRSKIFNPFFTTKEVGKGTGQGLAITHDIVQVKHGGRIWFETEMGKGTTFFVSLPAEDRTGKTTLPTKK